MYLKALIAIEIDPVPDRNVRSFRSTVFGSMQWVGLYPPLAPEMLGHYQLSSWWANVGASAVNLAHWMETTQKMVNTLLQ